MRVLLGCLAFCLVFIGCSGIGPEPTPTPFPPEPTWQPLPFWAEAPDSPTILPLTECTNPLATVNRGNLLQVGKCQPMQGLVNASEAGIDAFPNEVIATSIVLEVRALFQAAEAAGYPLRLTSGGRTCEYQEQVHDVWTERGNGDENYADTYTYHCGASSHHLGTVIDVVFGESGYEAGFGLAQGDTETYAWLQENVAEYGCVLEYPEGKEEITGLMWEPWHYRCGIPYDVAHKVQNGDFTLAEWLQQNADSRSR